MGVRNAEDGKIPWERLQAYFARAASEIHRESEALVFVKLREVFFFPRGCSTPKERQEHELLQSERSAERRAENGRGPETAGGGCGRRWWH